MAKSKEKEVPPPAPAKPKITGRRVLDAELAVYEAAARKVENCRNIIAGMEAAIREKADQIEDTKLILNRAVATLQEIVKGLGGVPTHDDTGNWVIPQ